MTRCGVCGRGEGGRVGSRGRRHGSRPLGDTQRSGCCGSNAAVSKVEHAANSQQHPPFHTVYTAIPTPSTTTHKNPSHLQSPTHSAPTPTQPHPHTTTTHTLSPHSVPSARTSLPHLLSHKHTHHAHTHTPAPTWMQEGGMTSQRWKWNSQRNSGKSCSSTSSTRSVPLYSSRTASVSSALRRKGSRKRSCSRRVEQGGVGRLFRPLRAEGCVVAWRGAGGDGEVWSSPKCHAVSISWGAAGPEGQQSQGTRRRRLPLRTDALSAPFLAHPAGTGPHPACCTCAS